MTRLLGAISSVWGRLLLACGIVLAPATMGALAHWSPSGSAQTGALQAGTFDLQLDGELVGPGGSISRDWSADDLIPGEFHSFGVVVGNGGDAGFTYRVDVAGAGWGYTDGAVVVQPYGGTPTADGSCSGGSVGTDRTVPPAGPLLVERSLDAGGSEPVCLRIGLLGNAPPANQGASGTLSFTFTATQQDPNP